MTEEMHSPEEENPEELFLSKDDIPNSGEEKHPKDVDDMSLLNTIKRLLEDSNTSMTHQIKELQPPDDLNPVESLGNLGTQITSQLFINDGASFKKNLDIDALLLKQKQISEMQFNKQIPFVGIEENKLEAFKFQFGIDVKIQKISDFDITQYLSQLDTLKQKESEGAKKYQDKVLAKAQEIVEIPDFTTAYRLLVQERNKPWKLKPSDIADFYLLAGFLSEHDVDTEYQDDSTYLAIAKARGSIGLIGRRLLVALIHEQLDEYDRFTDVNPFSVPKDIRAIVHDHFEHRENPRDGLQTAGKTRLEREINYYLADFSARLEQFAKDGRIMDIFTDTDTNAMFSVALRILESQQKGRWQIMASAMRALYDRSIPIKSFIKSISNGEEIGLVPDIEGRLERNREQFLIDRLLNYVHNTGTISARISNNFPLAATLLMAHGMPGHSDYLYFHSSLQNTSDRLGTEIRRYAKPQEGSNLIEDMANAAEIRGLPREYKFALALEFRDPQILDAVQKGSNREITPSLVYTLLQRVSHHDGRSRGRLRK